MKLTLGANYWSRAGGPRMWARYDEAMVASELAAARSMGLDLLRVFAFVPDFMPEPPTVDPRMLARLRQFCDAAGAAGLKVLFSPLVGHMSGENFDFPGRRGRSLWSDEEILRWQESLVAATATALHGSAGLFGIALSNEMPLWAGPGSAEERGAWCARLVAVARAAAPGIPVGSGEGLGGSWPVRALLPSVDFLGPHVYGGDLDPLRQAFAVDAAMATARPWGKPVVLEEFGASSTQAGPVEQAAYLRESILSAWASGAEAALWWCLSDFDAATLGLETPYVHHAFELGFGLFDDAGRRKLVGDELHALSALSLDVVREPARVALVRPCYLDEDVPFSWQDREAGERTMRQALVLCGLGGLDAVIVDEDAPLDDYALILCPSTQKLRTPTWHRLEARARAGAVVYWSWFSGDHLFHQGAWCPSFERLTGLRHRLRYGCFDLPPSRVELRGRIALDLPIDVVPAPSLSRLPIEVVEEDGAEIWAHDGQGRPALTSHRLGDGQVIFSPYPIERYLSRRCDGTHQAERLYRLLGNEAGLPAPPVCRSPEVQVRRLGSLVLAQNRGWSDVDGTIDLGDVGDLVDATLIFDRGNPSPTLFGPKGARIWRV